MPTEVQIFFLILCLTKGEEMQTRVIHYLYLNIGYFFDNFEAQSVLYNSQLCIY